MGRPRRRILWITLFAAAVLVVVGALALPRLVDVERYRGRIEGTLEQATGWQAELGAIRFSPWRGLVLAVRPARLVAPGDSSRIEIEALEIHAALVPLFRGELRIDSVDLVGPEIQLVRPSRRAGWIVPRARAAASERAAPETGGGLAVTVGRVRVRRGRIVADDRAARPPWKVELGGVDLDLAPTAGTLSGRATLGESGRLRFDGSLERGLAVEIDTLPTEALHPFVGNALVHAGGTLSGRVGVTRPLEIRATVSGRSITLLAGERPFAGTVDGELVLRPGAGAWRAESIALTAGGLKLSGRGTLLPRVALDLELPATPLQAVLDAAPSVLPLPLDLRPPGSVAARFRVDQPSGGEIAFGAAGELDAAAFVVDPMLPPVERVRASFALDRDGSLEVRLLEGTVAGGPAHGLARLSSIDPPGRLTFVGDLVDATLGTLLAGFVAKAKAIEGPTALRADLALDLDRPTIDARALGGRLDFESRDVALPGWDLEDAIRRQSVEKLGRLGALVGSAKSTPTPGAGAAVERRLRSVSAALDCDAWPWRLEGLTLDAEGLAATGAGSFDPLAGVVDLGVVARLSPERSASLVERAAALRVLVAADGRLTLPVRVRGAVTAPSIEVDLRQALAGKAGGASTEDAVRGLIHGLLERKKKPPP